MLVSLFTAHFRQWWRHKLNLSFSVLFVFWIHLEWSYCSERLAPSISFGRQTQKYVVFRFMRHIPGSNINGRFWNKTSNLTMKKGPLRGIEPVTSRTQNENHATRPSGHAAISISPHDSFSHPDFKCHNCPCVRSRGSMVERRTPDPEGCGFESRRD